MRYMASARHTRRLPDLGSPNGLPDESESGLDRHLRGTSMPSFTSHSTHLPSLIPLTTQSTPVISPVASYSAQPVVCPQVQRCVSHQSKALSTRFSDTGLTSKERRQIMHPSPSPPSPVPRVLSPSHLPQGNQAIASAP